MENLKRSLRLAAPGIRPAIRLPGRGPQPRGRRVCASPQEPATASRKPIPRTASGERNEAALADYAFRARGAVNEALRPVAELYYGSAPRYAYFIGCSGGGREALIEAERSPEDYDGFIAGAPWVNPRSALLGARNFEALLAAPIPYAAFAAIDRAVMDDCDARDGVRDNLIQNPVACGFDPATLAAAGVLTRAQADALSQYLSAVRDTNGAFVTYGAPVTGLGDLSPTFFGAPGAAGGLTGLSTTITDPPPSGGRPQPWGSPLAGPIDWPLGYGVISGFTFNDPAIDILGPRVLVDGRVQPDAVAETDRRVSPLVVNPSRMTRFFAQQRKLIIYHGFSDAITDPASTRALYHELEVVGGADTRDHARLFMIPDMQHCQGGTGPNTFDPLAAMEAWVERGEAPDFILAAHHPMNDPARAPDRTMPLCAYPAIARYRGAGDVNDAANWSCPAEDQGLLSIGPSGVRAGIGEPFPRR